MLRDEQLWRSLTWLARSFCACLLVLTLVSSARADDLSEFESARSRYDRHDYKRAVDAFRVLVGSDPPRISNALLVLESRKYYAASLLFVGANEEARLQFRLLLQQEPDYALDPLAFPTEVVALFESVKGSMRKELDRRREAELQEQRAAAQEAEALRLKRRENLARLRGLAEEQTIEVRNSRWLATVPFGVGQFQNGQRGLGVALAMAETFAAVTSVVTYFGHQGMVGDHATASNSDDLRQRERIWRAANWASFGTFAVLAIAGIVDAHVRYVPSRVIQAPRPLPDDLDRWAKEQAELLTGPKRF
ncbi:MAG TPA: hypothetical protein VFX59_31050 [Polyangiales bacterium]|nr:hypothetical protein [Polyangiales bacterium]